MFKQSLFAAAALLTVTLAGASSAKPALKDVAEISEGLIAVAIAYEIGEVCDDITARKLKGISVLFGLKRTASDLGYSSAEIDAYIDDKVEQKRLEGVARARLADMGAAVGQPATYCALGRAEIAKNSAIGVLLR